MRHATLWFGPKLPANESTLVKFYLRGKSVLLQAVDWEFFPLRDPNSDYCKGDWQVVGHAVWAASSLVGRVRGYLLWVRRPQYVYTY